MISRVISKTVELSSVQKVDQLEGPLYQLEDGGHTFEITCLLDGAAASISGTVSARFLRSDETTVYFTGTLTDNVVSITLPQSCYNVNGRFGMVVFVSGSDVTSAVYAVAGSVYRTTSDTVIDPSGEFPTYEQVLAIVTACETATTNATTAAANANGAVGYIADTYAAGNSYAVGSYCIHNGSLYKCTTAVASSTDWATDSASFSVSQLSDEIVNVKSDLDNETDNSFGSFVYGSEAYIPLSWEYGTINASGTEVLEDRDYYARTKDYFIPSDDIVLNVAYILADSTNVIVLEYNSSNVMQTRTVYGDSDFSVTLESGTRYRFVYMASSGNTLDLHNMQSYVALTTATLVYQTTSEMSEKADASTVNAITQKMKLIEPINIADNSTITSGFMQADGAISSSDTYAYSDYIEVEEGATYTFWWNHSDTIETTYVRFITAFDSNKNVISASGSSSNTSSYTVPSNIAYVIVSAEVAVWDSFVMLKGTEYVGSTSGETYFDPYYVAKDAFIPQAISLAGNEAIYKEEDSLESGTSLSFTNSEFPIALKKGGVYSFEGEFSSFTKLIIGKGYQTYLSKWLEIDDTNIVIKGYSTEETTYGTIAHGLTFSGNIKVAMNIDSTGYAHTLISTLGGVYQHDFNFGYEVYGAFTVIPSQNMTNVKLGASSSDFKMPLWIFGDSYMGVNDYRIAGQLRNFGYFDNLLIDAVGGQTSTNALIELNSCLQYGTPKILVWALGMNDNLDNYKLVYSDVSVKCERLGITLILYKIPTVASRVTPNNAINSFVESLSYRYVDAFSAVGADTSGNWYGDYLSSDAVHPSESGAKAIAMEMLIDVPEIMQYGWTEVS